MKDSRANCMRLKNRLGHDRLTAGSTRWDIPAARDQEVPPADHWTGCHVLRACTMRVLGRLLSVMLCDRNGRDYDWCPVWRTVRVWIKWGLYEKEFEMCPDGHRMRAEMEAFCEAMVGFQGAERIIGAERLGSETLSGSSVDSVCRIGRVPVQESWSTSRQRTVFPGA